MNIIHSYSADFFLTAGNMGNDFSFNGDGLSNLLILNLLCSCQNQTWMTKYTCMYKTWTWDTVISVIQNNFNIQL